MLLTVSSIRHSLQQGRSALVYMQITHSLGDDFFHIWRELRGTVGYQRIYGEPVFTLLSALCMLMAVVCVLTCSLNKTG